MKEPKFPRLEDLPKDNKYNFFAEGVFPDSVEEKKDRNKSAQKKKRLPFSLPVEETRPANTQKEDDLVPFFAKNYPPSSESKEDICFINSPPPSDTPDNNGEAEEVDVDEEESEENKKKNLNKMDNDDIGVSMDFNSEMENEYENPSKLTSREEVQERIRKNQERKKEEQRKKEEEEKRRKELEEKNRKEEEKKRKEKEEKEKAKEKEGLKKIEEEKKKKIKSNKKEPLNMLSSIKKNSEDTSNIASNSMINDVQNFFAIPEEKGENESEEDTTKKNFKKSSKEKSIINELSQKKIPTKSKKEDKDKEKIKSKKNPKSIINDNKETKETLLNKESKKNKISRKSNGINEEKEKPKEKNELEEEKEETYSNYGDQLADMESDDIEHYPKKEKVKSKKGKKRQRKPTVKKVDQDNRISQVEIYKVYTEPKNIQLVDYDVTTDESENTEGKTFGDKRQYSLRNRIPTLRHDLNERIQYIYDQKGLPNAKRVYVARRATLDDVLRKTVEKYEQRKLKKKKRLRKGLNNNDTIKEESDEYNSELLDSENISEYGEDEARILKIPKGGKKSLAKNYDTLLIIKIIEANGKNMIKVDNKEYKDLKSDNEVKVNKNQNFEILNFSDDYLVVQLVFDENH